ncbi:Acyl-CoA oxidase [Cooperia oncophora]
MNFMKEDMYRLLAKLRPNAVSLVDSWDISDHELRSVLGRRDGHVYENLYKWAQESELNRTQVLPTFEKYLKPMMMEARKQSKL